MGDFNGLTNEELVIIQDAVMRDTDSYLFICAGDASKEPICKCQERIKRLKKISAKVGKEFKARAISNGGKITVDVDMANLS